MRAGYCASWPGARSAQRSRAKRPPRCGGWSGPEPRCLMTRSWRQAWPAAAVAGATLAVVVVNLLVDGYARQQEKLAKGTEDYSRIEDGLYLGAYVPEPPRGTS